MPDQGRAAMPDLRGIRLFAEASPAAILVLASPAHRILYANPACAAAVGRDATELAGAMAAEAIPGLAAAGLLTACDQVRATGKPWRMAARSVALGPAPCLWD